MGQIVGDRGDSMKKAGLIQAAIMAVLGIAFSAYAISAFAAESTGGPAGPAKPAHTSAPADGAHAGSEPPEWKFFDQYCGKCHNSTDWAGGVAFDAMRPDTMDADAKV